MLLTALFFPGMCFSVAFALNTIAIFYGSLAAVPFLYILAVLLLWGFISFPLCLLGTIMGRRLSGNPNYPCRCACLPARPSRCSLARPHRSCTCLFMSVSQSVISDSCQSVLNVSAGWIKGSHLQVITPFDPCDPCVLSKVPIIQHACSVLLVQAVAQRCISSCCSLQHAAI